MIAMNKANKFKEILFKKRLPRPIFYVGLIVAMSVITTDNFSRWFSNISTNSHSINAVKIDDYIEKDYIEKTKSIFKTGLAVNESNHQTAKEVIQMMDSLIIKDPLNAIAYSYRARAKNVLEETEGAIADASQSIIIQPNFSGYYARGFAYNKISNYSKSIYDLNKAIEINPNSYNAYGLRALVREELKDYEGAIDDLTKLIEINPNEQFSYLSRGRILGFIRRYHEAIDDFSTVIAINPEYWFPYSARGIAKNSLEDYSSAIVDFSTAISLNPDATYSYIYRGKTKIHLEMYEEAISDYDKAIEIDPYSSESYFYRGWIKGILKDYSGAISDYNQAIEIDPKFYKLYANRGWSKMQLKDYEGALTDYNKSIELDSINKSPSGIFNDTCFINNELRNYSQAIKDCTRSIQIDPKSYLPYSNRAISRKNIGDMNGACEDLKKAFDLGDIESSKTWRKDCN